MSTEERMFEYPKLLKQVSVVCDLQFRIWFCCIIMFLDLSFLAFKCLTLKNGSFLHVVCKNKHCVAMVYMPAFAEVQKPAR